MMLQNEYCKHVRTGIDETSWGAVQHPGQLYKLRCFHDMADEP